MLDQDNNFYLINLSILITCLWDDVWDIIGRSYMLISSRSLRVKGHFPKADISSYSHVGKTLSSCIVP